jgi:hypothetical protein
MPELRRRPAPSAPAGARRLSAATAIALTLLLAGCGGIPTSGNVEAGPGISEDAEIDLGFAPQGPRSGSTQEDIVQDFIIAATDPQSDYSVAREFLSEDFEAEWEPDAITTIRTGAGTVRRETDTSLVYSYTSAASINSDGLYTETEPASGSLELSFVKEGDQWRISDAPDGIVLSEDSFDNVFGEYPLYYFDPTYQYLVPDVRWFPNRTSTPIRVAASLMRGQTSWLAGGVLVSAFPAGTALGDGLVSVTSSVATVDLTEDARSASGIERERMRQQLAATLSTVSSVVLTIGGVQVETQTGVASAVTNPPVEGAPLVLTEEGFGFVSNDDLTTIGQLSQKVVDLGATAATLARGKNSAAVLAPGGVFAVRSGAGEPLHVDSRADLVAPSIDNSGFIWSVPASNPSALRAFALDGTAYDVASTLQSDARMVSIAVSRDGARVLVYLATPIGPQLFVAGIVRAEGVPVGLGELSRLPVGAGVPIGATWVDDRTVATLSQSGTDTLATAVEIGGPTVSLGQVEGGRAIVGGNGGTDGLRVLGPEGQVYRPRGTSWQRTGVEAMLLATQQ